MKWVWRGMCGGRGRGRGEGGGKRRGRGGEIKTTVSFCTVSYHLLDSLRSFSMEYEVRSVMYWAKSGSFFHSSTKKKIHTHTHTSHQCQREIPHTPGKDSWKSDQYTVT
jgi:hypothetical protein